MPSPENQTAGTLADLQRLLHNIVRVGSIHSVQHGNPPRVRVKLSADGEGEGNGEALITDWRPYVEQRAGKTKTWNPPTVGEQCVVLAPGGDLGAGVVLGSITSTQNPAPSTDPNATVTEYPDGARVDYNHATHEMAITLPGGGTVTLTAPASVTIDSPETTITGNCLVQGRLTYQGGMTGSGGAGGAAAQIAGNVEITGEATATGDVKAGGISLQGHNHQGVHGPTGAAQ